MNIILICVAAVITSIICVLLKRYNQEYSMVIALACGVLVIISVLSSISPIICEIKSLVYQSKLPVEYIGILLKVLGVCFLTQFASDACKDAGESVIASKVELAGKVTIVLISLPLFERITQTVLTLIG